MLKNLKLENLCTYRKNAKGEKSKQSPKSVTPKCNLRALIRNRKFSKNKGYKPHKAITIKNTYGGTTL